MKIASRATLAAFHGGFGPSRQGCAYSHSTFGLHRMSALTQKRTICGAKSITASPSKADMGPSFVDVR
jgi:hypothetical protein